MSGHKKITRRAWMIRQAIVEGADPMMAIEAVSSVLIDRPDLDPEEKRTEAEWEASSG